MIARRFFRDLAFTGIVALAVLLCLGYFVGAFIAFLWIACAGIAWAGVR